MSSWVLDRNSRFYFQFFNIFQHLCGRAITFCWLVGASFKDDIGKIFAGIRWWRKYFAFHTSTEGVFSVSKGNWIWNRWKKRQTVTIHKFVKYQAERINIDICAIRLTKVDFRCHIAFSAFFRKSSGCFFNRSGYAKITEFKLAGFVDKDVFWFNVPMNHTFSLTK